MSLAFPISCERTALAPGPAISPTENGGEKLDSTATSLGRLPPPPSPLFSYAPLRLPFPGVSRVLVMGPSPIDSVTSATVKVKHRPLAVRIAEDRRRRALAQYTLQQARMSSWEEIRKTQAKAAKAAARGLLYQHLTLTRTEKRIWMSRLGPYDRRVNQDAYHPSEAFIYWAQRIHWAHVQSEAAAAAKDGHDKSYHKDKPWLKEPPDHPRRLKLEHRKLAVMSGEDCWASWADKGSKLRNSFFAEEEEEGG